MDNLEAIMQEIDERLAAKDRVREGALSESRLVVQQASKAIRAVHRHEWADAERLLTEMREVVRALNEKTLPLPDLYWSGYVQDAQKEYAEAHLTLSLVRHTALPRPTDLGVEDASYLNGMAEAASELRRYILDLVRDNRLPEADTLLEAMEDVYSRLIAVDYPHAITNNLRRTTDTLRAVLERTRGDVTTAMKQHELQEALRGMEALLKGSR